MSDFSAFFAENKVKHENLKYVASKDFIDKDGKPLEWEIRRIDSDEDAQIRKSCTRQVKVQGRNGITRSDMDVPLYQCKMAVASIVYPDLNNKKLQDSYNVMSADLLLKKMLAPGEYTDLINKVVEHNGFDLSLGDLVDEAKN